jgi:hypothetical protein
VLTIGDERASREYQFSRLTAVRRLPDGGVVLANAGSAEVRAYAPDGTFRWSVGQPGDGPGDFRSLARVEVLAGDTILALDYQGPRLTWIGPDGTISRTIQVLDPAQCGPPRLGGRPPNLVILNCPRPRARSPGVHREPRSVIVLDPVVGDTLRIAAVDGPEVAHGPGGRWWSPPLGLVTALAARDSLIFVGTGDRFEIAVFTDRGTRLTPYRVPGQQRVAVTDAMRLSLAEDDRRALVEFARARGRDTSAVIEGGERPLPETRDSLPLFGQFLVDPDLNLWVGEYTVGRAPPAAWTVIATSGQVVGTVTLPAGFTLHEPGRDYVLGVWRDEDGVEQIRMYELRRGG